MSFQNYARANSPVLTFGTERKTSWTEIILAQVWWPPKVVLVQAGPSYYYAVAW
jgi:hypothetical protein